mgnify:CR=1 FL=1
MIEILRAMETLIAASEEMVNSLTRPLADAALTEVYPKRNRHEVIGELQQAVDGAKAAIKARQEWQGESSE